MLREEERRTLLMAYQFPDLVMDGVAPVKEMVIENSWYSWVSEYVCITLQDQKD